MAGSPEVVVESSAERLAEHVARRVLALLAAALSERSVAHLGVTGGGILEQVMRAVHDSPESDSLEWQRVHVWWGDERYVAADSDDRNDKAAFAALLDALPLDPGKVHRMPTSDGQFGEDAEAAAAAYAQELAAAAAPDGEGPNVPDFDAMLLGIGPDGHCASLFPGHPGVRETTRTVIAVHDSPKPPSVRLSLTLPALDAAREVWFIASGDSKAQAVARALSGADPEQVPSAGPHGKQRTVWLVDRAAASQLAPQPAAERSS